MEWDVSVQGSGTATIPKIEYYGSFTVECNSLLQSQSISISLRSIPDPHFQNMNDEKIYFWICGEVAILIGTLYEKSDFVAPFIYSIENRTIKMSLIESVNPESDKYVTLDRCY